MEKIFKTLSQIDLSGMVEKKMGLTYLSWANAWDVIMSNYPSATFDILDPVVFGDGSMEVWTQVTIEGNSRKMWLPVMDNRNQAIKNPSSRQVSDNRMRCLVKNLAMFGLGLYIYQGEDLPRQTEQSVEIDIMEAILTLSTAQDLNSLTANFKRLTKGLNPKSDSYTRLKEVAAQRKGELNERA